MKSTQALLSDCGEALSTFTPTMPEGAPAGAEKIDLLKHALRHNVNEISRFVQGALRLVQNTILIFQKMFKISFCLRSWKKKLQHRQCEQWLQN